jgi:hypothetical protein
MALLIGSVASIQGRSLFRSRSTVHAPKAQPPNMISGAVTARRDRRSGVPEPAARRVLA